MRSLGILLAPIPQGLVKIVKRCNGRNRNKSISAAVTHLVFHVSLFVAGRRVTELCPETVMQHKPSEAVCEDSVCTLEYLHNSGGHIVKAQHRRNAANVLKDALHPLQKAFLVLRGEGLRVTLIGVGKGNGQRIAVLLLPCAVVVEMLAKIHLSAAQRVLQRQIPAVLRVHHETLFADILLYAGIAAAKAVLIPQATEDPLYGVALLARNFAVSFQPFVDYGNEISQHRIAFWLGIR